MTSTLRTFMDYYRAGRVTPDGIDDWVDMWHDAPAGTTPALLELHAWLGFTPAEYARWVERNELPAVDTKEIQP